MAVGTAMMIAGTGLKVASKIGQAQTAKKASKFNAAQLEQQASRVEQDSRRQSTAQQKNAERTLASIRARFAKSGLDFVGTPVEVLAEKKFLLDQEMRESKRAAGSETRRLRSGASEQLRMGKKAFTSGLISAAGDAFSFAAPIMSDRASLLNQGPGLTEDPSLVKINEFETPDFSSIPKI
jgi:hypothetical protein